MKKRIAIAVLAMATNGLACSGATLAPDGGAYGNNPPDTTLDAGLQWPTEDAQAPSVMEDAAAQSYEDAALQPYEDAALQPYEDATPQSYEDASVVFDASPSACPAPPVGHDACWASCCTPAGPAATLASVADVAAALTGAWQFCGGADGWRALGPPDASGVEFAADGQLYFLVQQPGGLVRGPGFEYRWSYAVEPVDGTFQVSLFPSAQSGFSSAVRYSPCPRELEFASLGSGGPALLVAAP